MQSKERHRAISEKGRQMFIKQVIDYVIAAFLLILTAPLFIIFSVLIKLDSKGPALFTQLRVGLSGRLFRAIKFRSMVEDAESMKLGIADLNEVQGPVFKMADDPRVTKFGRFLRKYYLDELPQLLNVLKGDMSIVGPRPPLPEEVEQYLPWQRRRLSMKPGLTGSWQIHGVGIKNFDERVRLDLDYIDNWSLWLDFKIGVRTFLFILSGKGV